MEYLDQEERKERFFASKEEALAALKEIDGEAKVREATLEDVFIKLTGRRINV